MSTTTREQNTAKGSLNTIVIDVTINTRFVLIVPQVAIRRPSTPLMPPLLITAVNRAIGHRSTFGAQLSLKWSTQECVRNRLAFLCTHSSNAKLSESEVKGKSLSSLLLKNKENLCKTLKKWFKIDNQDVDHIFEEFPSIATINVKELQNRISLLHLKNLCLPEVALKRTWILTVDKNSLISGLKLLESKKLLNTIEENSHLFAMFIFDKKEYQRICKRINFGFNLFFDFDQRLDFFRSNLEINTELFCAIVRANHQILTKDMNHIEEVMLLLKDRVDREDLITDHWIFIHNIDRMKRRIEESEGLIKPLKPWNLRCPERVWRPMIDNLRKDLQVLANDDIVSFMAKKLNCSPSHVRELMDRSPRTSSIRPGKLDQVITLLLQSGYSSSDIFQCPRVLSHSPKRIKQRIEQAGPKTKLKLCAFLMTDQEFKIYRNNLAT